MSKIRARPSFTTALVALVALLALGALGSLLAGAADLGDPALRATLLELRAHRVLAACLAGAALAVGGVLVQGFFRNALATPEILGTTAGAALGSKLALFFHSLLAWKLSGWVPPESLIPLGAVAGALGALSLLVAIVRRKRDIVLVLLVGFLLSALFSAVGGLLTVLSQGRWELARALSAQGLGDISGVGGGQLWVSAPLVLVGLVAAWFWARPLDVMLSGEDEAASLGVDVRRTQLWCIVWTAMLTAGAVGLGGNVGFVGLIVPHVMRRFVGVGHQRLVLACTFAGALFLLGADSSVRLLPSSSEVPLGVVTGLLGAPMFLWLLLKARAGRHA